MLFLKVSHVVLEKHCLQHNHNHNLTLSFMLSETVSQFDELEISSHIKGCRSVRSSLN